MLIGLAALALAGDVGTAQDDRTTRTETQTTTTDKAKAATDAKVPETAADAGSPDERAIGSQAEAFVKAFNAGDAKAVARLHTTDARVIDAVGEVAEGRDAIEQEYAGLFEENPGLTIEIHQEDLRLVSPDAAIEEGTSRVIPDDGAPPVINHYSAVSVKRDGQWLLASVRERAGPLVAEDQLRALEWMTGDWVDESEDSLIQSSCHWTEDKQALLREFTIRCGGKVVMTGTQRIGWDPCAEQIKSWEFDSQGGHGEGLWARLGDHWIVKATAVLQDGRTSTATHVITPEDSSTCRWRTTDRTVGGHVIAVADEFVMVRPAPVAKAK